ncbi:helix-turn-helix domain-containing protein [Aneurinibacillus danicus]|uniref:helix-turn-helix domain-containing protein n=1 Tax=Aneurinibacillus danicus TaxID=267746 RepID=UPI0035316348
MISKGIEGYRCSLAARKYQLNSRMVYRWICEYGEAKTVFIKGEHCHDKKKNWF